MLARSGIGTAKENNGCRAGRTKRAALAFVLNELKARFDSGSWHKKTLPSRGLFGRVGIYPEIKSD